MTIACARASKTMPSTRGYVKRLINRRDEYGAHVTRVCCFIFRGRSTFTCSARLLIILWHAGTNLLVVRLFHDRRYKPTTAGTRVGQHRSCAITGAPHKKHATEVFALRVTDKNWTSKWEKKKKKKINLAGGSFLVPPVVFGQDDDGVGCRELWTCRFYRQ